MRTQTLLPLSIGHCTIQEHSTGVTVFLLPEHSQAAAWLCGSAPATREFALLDATNSINSIHALVFAGGSAYGLDCAAGVMQWLKQRDQGVNTAYGKVPIVPTACIYDLTGDKAQTAPQKEHAYQACEQARVTLNPDMGCVGAGTGSKVCRILMSEGTPMRGGFGFAFELLNDGCIIAAAVVVNPAGYVYDQGLAIAGRRNHDGHILPFSMSALNNTNEHFLMHPCNTILAAVFTNAQFSSPQLTRIAKMASAGIARSIQPAFTALDGDIVYAVSMGKKIINEVISGHIASKLIYQSIIAAVLKSNAAVISGDG